MKIYNPKKNERIGSRNYMNRINLRNAYIMVSLGGVALWRESLGKPLYICAVIINHVVLLHPFKPVLICSVQLL